jgi:hypothetical protein
MMMISPSRGLSTLPHLELPGSYPTLDQSGRLWRAKLPGQVSRRVKKTPILRMKKDQETDTI